MSASFCVLSNSSLTDNPAIQPYIVSDTDSILRKTVSDNN
jgi:hypothetical protein